MIDIARRGERGAASGSTEAERSTTRNSKTSHNIVNVFALIAAALEPSQLEIAHCFFIVQWCALQHGGGEFAAVSALAQEMAMMVIESIKTACRTCPNRTIGRSKLPQLMRECLPVKRLLALA